MKALLRTFGYILLGFLLGSTSMASAQNCLPQRYRQAMFDVDTLVDVQFGTAPAIPAVYISEDVTVPYDLKMDIYLPEGDTLSQRPVVMFAFGGGFLIGSKEDADVRSLCDSFARKGYVAAAINYRLGLNTVSDGSAERAVWRGVQDWSAAIRFLKENHLVYRLDTHAIFAGGASAGSFAAMHCQYATDAQRPASTLAAGLPFPQPDLGCKDCEGNSYAHTSSVRALINCWGAIGDTNWIDNQDSVPMISFHGDLDPIVPYAQGFPFTALFTMPQVYGSSLISIRQTHVGLQHQMNTFFGEGHNIWGTIVSNEFTPSPTQYWIPILDSIRNFLWNILEPAPAVITGAQSVAVSDVHTYSVAAIAGYRWCWTVDGGTILSPNTASNSIDIRWDLAGVRSVKVRPVSHLDAVGPETTSLIQVLPLGLEPARAFDAQAMLVNEGLKITASDLPGGELDLTLMDVLGRKCYGWSGIAGKQFEAVIPTENMGAGIYCLRLETWEGAVNLKVLIPR